MDGFMSLNQFMAQNRLAVNGMRPFIDKNGEPMVLVNRNGQQMKLRANDALLRYDEWKDIDRKVIGIATERLVGIADLQGRGLTHNLGSLGVTIAQWQTSSDMTGADVSMSGVTAGEEDSVAFGTESVPVPIIHKDFRINIRRLEASRRMGESLDTIQAAIAGRVVAEKSEDMLFGGLPVVVEGQTIYGYLTHPDVNTVDMTTSWDLVAQADNDDIVAEVSAMLQAARNARHYGPYVLYIPGEYQFKLDQDYRANDNRTLRERLLGLDGLSDIKIADRLEGDNVILVQLTSDVVDLAMAQDITTVQWMTQGGMVDHFKVMACWAPRIKSDHDGRSGIVVLKHAGS